MRPMTTVSIGAAGAYGGLALMRFMALLAFLFVIATIGVVNTLAWAFPGLVALILPGVIAYVGFQDVLGLGAVGWELLGHLGRAIHLGFVVFTIMAVLWGAQRRHHGQRFILGRSGAYVINDRFFSPSVTPWWRAWLLSTIAGSLLAAFVPPAEMTAFALRIWAAMEPVLVWLHEEGGLHNLNGWELCQDLNRGRPCGFWKGALVFPNGLFWLVLYLLSPFLVKLLFGFLSLFDFRWAKAAYPVVRLLLPGVILFLLTTTYFLNTYFWLFWVAWGLYGAWLIKEVIRPHFAARREALFVVAGILSGLVIASDVDWALKQHLNVTIFGTTDVTARYEREQGNPPVAWGGVPRLVFGISPIGWVVERLS